jgi:CAAX prenyl protease-like protein
MIGLAIPYAGYPWVYTAKIVLTVAAMLVVMPGYRQFPFRVSWRGLLTGVLGVVVWVGLCRLQSEGRLLGSWGLARVFDLGARSAFNPLEQLRGHAAWARSFLAIRLFGLAVVVPVIEEFFLRGFVMRFLVAPSWWKVPFGTVNTVALVAGTLVPMLMHPPQELLATAAWFSLVTWLMVTTKNIWDCVAAHAVTNLLLGVYVVVSGQWQWM